MARKAKGDAPVNEAPENDIPQSSSPDTTPQHDETAPVFLPALPKYAPATPSKAEPLQEAPEDDTERFAFALWNAGRKDEAVDFLQRIIARGRSTPASKARPIMVDPPVLDVTANEEPIEPEIRVVPVAPEVRAPTQDEATPQSSKPPLWAISRPLVAGGALAAIAALVFFNGDRIAAFWETSNEAPAELALATDTAPAPIESRSAESDTVRAAAPDPAEEAPSDVPPVLAGPALAESTAEPTVPASELTGETIKAARDVTPDDAPASTGSVAGADAGTEAQPASWTQFVEAEYDAPRAPQPDEPQLAALTPSLAADDDEDQTGMAIVTRAPEPSSQDTVPASDTPATPQLADMAVERESAPITLPSVPELDAEETSVAEEPATLEELADTVIGEHARLPRPRPNPPPEALALLEPVPAPPEHSGDPLVIPAPRIVQEAQSPRHVEPGPPRHAELYDDPGELTIIGRVVEPGLFWRRLAAQRRHQRVWGHPRAYPYPPRVYWEFYDDEDDWDED